MFIKNPLTWVVLALLGMFTIAGLLGDASRTEHPLSGTQAAKKTDDAKDKQRSTSALGEVPPTLDAKKQPREYAPDCSESKHADLCAQRRMAKAAEDQTSLNMIGLVLLFFTLFATGAAALFARQAARAAQRTVQVMDVTAKRQLRAYVNYNGGNVIDFNGTKPPFVQVVIKNFGQTPAYNVQMRIDMWLTAMPLTTPFPAVKADTQPRGVLGPQAHFVIGRTLQDFTPAMMAAVRDGRRGLFVFGDIVYEDAFGQEQRTAFRLVYGGGEEIHPDGSLATCEDGNDAT